MRPTPARPGAPGSTRKLPPAIPLRGAATASTGRAAPPKPAARSTPQPGGTAATRPLVAAQGSCFSRCCPNRQLDEEGGRQSAVGLCIFFYAIFCFVAAFTSGWYKVQYSPDITVPTCSMPLWECSLAACKPEVSRTGYIGEGECSTQQFAQLLFIFAALYALCYLMFISGILVPGQGAGLWIKGNFSKCCSRSSECDPRGVGMGDKKHLGPVQCLPCPHGVLICGTPLLMLLGLFTVVIQDRTSFETMPEQGYGPVFWISLLLALCMCFIAFFTTKAESGLQAAKKRALPPRPPRNQPTTLTMPPSAPHGFSFYTPPSEQPIIVQTQQELKTHAPKLNKRTQVNRIKVDDQASWQPITQVADFKHLVSSRP